MPGVCLAVAPTQAYPTKLMRPVTLSPAGCSVDFIGRIIVKGLSE